MKNYTLTFLILIATILGSCKQKEVKKETSGTQETTTTSTNSKDDKQTFVYGDKIMDSKEFQDYFDIFFKQSDPKTGQTLIYVNKYLSKNNIVVSEGACALLKNEKIKSDSISFNYFDKRCKFLNARKKLREKFNINGDSINKLMRKAIEIKREYN